MFTLIDTMSGHLIYRTPPQEVYLTRTVTFCTVSVYCTGIWIGIFCDLSFYVYFFTASRSLALRARGLEAS